MSSNINTRTDWIWYKQLKFEMGKRDQAEIMMCRAKFDYTYEY